MRVLQVASSLHDWGGIERYVAYLTEGLRHRGHSVTVACSQKSPLDERIGEPKTHLTLKKQFSARSYLAYRRFFSVSKYDVIHVHFSPDFIMPVLAARRQNAGKVIVTRHVALRWSPTKAKRYGNLFDHIIPVSHAVEEKLAESGIPAEMMTVAKAGAPALAAYQDVATTRSELQVGQDDFVIGSFGRLVKEKGIDVLLKAMTSMDKGQLLVFGEGPERASLESLAGSLAMQNRVRFMGFVPNVAEAMNACDVIAVPSVWDEAFPYSILEAMSLGKPVVASRVGGLPEIVRDGVTGRLFARGDDTELAQVLSEMNENRPLNRKMGETALAEHRAEYTVERMAERIEQVYLKVL